MNKTVLFLLFLTFTASGYSQISIGPKMGILGTNLDHESGSFYGATIIESKPYYGIQAGASVIIETNRTFRPQLEIFYFQEGNNFEVKHYSENNNFDLYNIRQNRRYLRTNIVFNIGRAWTKHPNFRLYGAPGISLGYLIGYDTEPEYQPKNQRINYSDLAKTNFAVFVGFAAGYKIGPGWLEFSPRVQVSLVPYRYEPSSWFDTPLFSANISFSIGYTFLIGNPTKEK